jgi:hypothetical protein
MRSTLMLIKSGKTLNLICNCATSHGGGEDMSEQNEFGRVSVEELEKAFETEEQEEEKE